jgi:hypothetical protein
MVLKMKGYERNGKVVLRESDAVLVHDVAKMEGGLPSREWENLIIRSREVKRESVFLILTVNVPQACKSVRHGRSSCLRESNPSQKQKSIR